MCLFVWFVVECWSAFEGLAKLVESLKEVEVSSIRVKKPVTPSAGLGARALSRMSLSLEGHLPTYLARLPPTYGIGSLLALGLFNSLSLSLSLPFSF